MASFLGRATIGVLSLSGKYGADVVVNSRPGKAALTNITAWRTGATMSKAEFVAAEALGDAAKVAGEGVAKGGCGGATCSKVHVRYGDVLSGQGLSLGVGGRRFVKIGTDQTGYLEPKTLHREVATAYKKGYKANEKLAKDGLGLVASVCIATGAVHVQKRKKDEACAKEKDELKQEHRAELDAMEERFEQKLSRVGDSLREVHDIAMKVHTTQEIAKAEAERLEERDAASQTDDRWFYQKAIDWVVGK